MASDSRNEALEAYRRFAQGEEAFRLEERGRSQEWGEIGITSRAASETPRGESNDRGPQPRHTTTLTAFGLLALLSEPQDSPTVTERLKCFELVVKAIEEQRPLPVGAVLERFVRGLECLDLTTQDAPWPRTRKSPVEWLDMALAPTRLPVQFIPVSVFTRRFFHQDLPSLSDPSCDVDPFHYHPENDKQHWFEERFGDVSEAPMRFQYFIDESGMTEIVLDVENIGWAESDFAAALFCRYNGIPKATLDGIPVVTLGSD